MICLHEIPDNLLQEIGLFICLDQPKLPEDRLYSGTVFHGKADIDPLALQVGNEDGTL